MPNDKMSVISPADILYDFLVIGSVHLDVIGDAKNNDFIDCIGNINLSLGGQGYNIAKCLNTINSKPVFITGVSDKSIIKDLIEHRIPDIAYPIFVDHPKIKEGAYVGIRHKNEIIKSVTASPIEDVIIDPIFLNKYIEKAKSGVIIELNNSVETLLNTVKITDRLKKPLIVCVTSDNKTNKIINILENTSPNAIFITNSELNILLNLLKLKIKNKKELLKISDSKWFIFDDLKIYSIFKDNNLKPRLISKKIFCNSHKKHIFLMDAAIAAITNNLYKRNLSLSSTFLKKIFYNVKHIINLSVENENLQHQIHKINDKNINTDQMTGLYNKTYIFNRLSEITSDQSNLFSFIIIDIDKFKQINDTKGHIYGDEIIVNFANIVKSSIRTSDIAGRFGGDEFMILMPNCNKHNAKKIVNRILNRTRKTGLFTCSIGITDNSEYKNKEEIISNADDALYKAKNNGRNQIYVI